jgi:hypothetical protein
MTKDRKNRVAIAAGPERRRPIRVKLGTVSALPGTFYSPEGFEDWRERLRSALGTCSDDFVDAALIQLQYSARLPLSGISEIAVNAALALIEAAAPRDEIEGALAVQMACTHTAAMAVLARIGGGHGSEQRMATFGSAAARLLRAYGTQVEVLRRLRHGGQQYVRVEYVHVSDGGQAVIGNVKGSDTRKLAETERGMRTQTKSVEPIEQLLEQDCDLNLDVLPAVGDLVAAPGQPPLCSWTAAPTRQPAAERAVPPPQRGLPSAPRFDMDELVAGYRAGNVDWDVTRLGPPPGSPGCRVDPTILRGNGYG